MARVGAVLLRATRYLIVGLSLAFVLVILWGVVSRYVLNWAVAWTEELAVFLMIWLTFLGISVAAAERAHIGMVTARDRLAPRIRRYVVLLLDMLVLVFLCVVAVEGYRLATSVWSQRSAALRVSFFWPYVSIPVGATLMILQHALIALRDFHATRCPAGRLRGEPKWTCSPR
jgi:TRAP-type C4-dicarboxylate transport system permease small subunit